MAMRRPTDTVGPMTVEAFLDWLETRPETERWELIEGEPVRVMAPETVRHVRLKRNAAEALRAAIAAGRLPCEALGDGVAVRFNPNSWFQPDAVVTCTESIDPDAVEVPEPVIAVEVISPSTRSRDFTAKMQGYFALPSVQHYLLVEPRKRLIVHMRRGPDGTLTTAFRHEGPIDLDPPGIALRVEDVYAGVGVD
jgi:Uma2 family endonuclease